MANTSTLSKKHKSPEWKAKKRAQHEANIQLRRDLNKKKHSGRHEMSRRVEAQREIDMIGQRGK